MVRSDLTALPGCHTEQREFHAGKQDHDDDRNGSRIPGTPVSCTVDDYIANVRTGTSGENKPPLCWLRVAALSRGGLDSGGC
jgi:hypothetical protein